MVQRLLIIVFAIVGCFLLMGCTGSINAHVCKAIYISKDDVLTKGTASQILVHNESCK